MSNYQEGRLLERPSCLPPGASPRSLTLVLEDDLVDSLSPGSEVLVVGTLVHRWLPMSKGQRAVLEAVLCVASVEPTGLSAVGSGQGDRGAEEEALREANFADFWGYFKSAGRCLAGRDALLKSFCPQLHSMAIIKLALA